MVTKSLEHVVLAKESSQPQSSYEAAATLTEFELKKILIDKMDKSKSYLAAPKHGECYEGLIKYYDLDKSLFSTYGPKAKESKSGSSKGTKSQPKSSGKSVQSEEPEFEALLEKLDWENLEGDDYPFDLTKPLPLVMSRNRQKVPVDYFFNNDLKYLQGGISTMTYMTSLTKTKATQYDFKGIEDMVPNIWVHVKVAYDKHALWVEVMRKHGYGYLKEIVVRRADNDLYKFKEGDFPRLRINDIEDMLLLVVQNRLINLSGNDVSDFAIALRMFTRSLVIHKRVEDLQLRVESYQKKINSPGHKLPYPASGKETRTLHTKTLKDSFMSKTMGETG
ncbi:hypothetical protein Tco_0352649 [Tanacetum coccineum]